MNKVFEWYKQRQVLFCFYLALLLNFLIEVFSRRSLFNGVKHLLTSPHIFLYNSLIIFSVLLISLLFKKKIFIMFVISAIWLALGISNNIVLGYRITPLAAIDLKIMKSAFSMASVYFGPLQFVTLGIAVIRCTKN